MNLRRGPQHCSQDGDGKTHGDGHDETSHFFFVGLDEKKKTSSEKVQHIEEKTMPKQKLRLYIFMRHLYNLRMVSLWTSGIFTENTPPKFNMASEKTDWKKILSYWGLVTF